MGLLDSILGDDTVKDEYGQTQADRRMPIWAGLVKTGGLLMAGGQRLMPEERAKYLGEAFNSVGDIPTQMMAQRKDMAQQALQRQQIEASKQTVEAGRTKLANQARLQQSIQSPEGQKMLAGMNPQERALLQMAYESGDPHVVATVMGQLDKNSLHAQQMANAAQGLDLKTQALELARQKAEQSGGKVGPNGEIIQMRNGQVWSVWRPGWGWTVKDGVPQNIGEDTSGGAPAPGSSPPPPPTPTTPPPPPAPDTSGPGGTVPPASLPPYSGAPAGPPPGAPPIGGGPVPAAATSQAANADPYAGIKQAPQPLRLTPQAANQMTTGVQQVPAPAPPPQPDIDQEIKQWSNMPSNWGMPHGLEPSPFAGRDYNVLKHLPAPIARQVQSIGDYNQAVSANQRIAKDPVVMDAVLRYTRGDWNQGEYAYRNQQRKEYSSAGATGRSMLAMDTAYQHLGKLWDAAKALDNGQLPLGNRLMQMFLTGAGKPANAGFDVAKTAVADEVAKAFRGQGALNQSEQAEWQKKFDAAKAPEQLQEVVEYTLDLLEGKERAIKSKFEGDMRTPMRDFLSVQSRQKAQQIRENKLGSVQFQNADGTQAAPTKTTPQIGAGEVIEGRLPGGKVLIRKPDGSQVVR